MSGSRPGEVRWFRVAVQALAVIAATDGACPSAAIAEGVSSHAAFLRRVLAQLARAGVVEAQEGRAGGYRLARPARDITLGEIYAAVKLAEPGDPGAGEAGKACPSGEAPPVCVATALDAIGAEVEQAIVETLTRHSLASVMAGAGEPARAG
jgi:Rrf2 family transcriptional regulator, repressor of oqxAB